MMPCCAQRRRQNEFLFPNLDILVHIKNAVLRPLENTVFVRDLTKWSVGIR